MRLGGFFLVLGEFFHRVIDDRHLVRVEFQLGKSSFVINRHRRAIFLRLLDVVDMDIVAEDRARIPVLQGYRRTGKGNEGGVFQAVAQVLGVAVLESAAAVCCFFQLGL